MIHGGTIFGVHWTILVADMFLFVVITLNLVVTMKARRNWREAKKFRDMAAKWYDERAQILIDALDDTALMVCPLCATAAGHGELMAEDGAAMVPEPEIDGKHVVRMAGLPGNGSADCRAARFRAQARRIFAESMGEKVE
jgi:hypothetical protein